MSAFEELLNADQEDIVRTLYRFRLFDARPNQSKLEYIAGRLKFTVPQTVCAIGYNPNSLELNEIFPILGCHSHTDITKLRDNYYINDVYQKLSLQNLLSIYKRIKHEEKLLSDISDLIKKRIALIEQKIEITVNSKTINRYKNEIKALYFDNIVGVNFAEERLSIPESGYRALLNEVNMIIESKTIPVSDLFFRENLSLEERRKILQRGLISNNLILKRLKNSMLNAEEKSLLEEHIQQKT